MGVRLATGEWIYPNTLYNTYKIVKEKEIKNIFKKMCLQFFYLPFLDMSSTSFSPGFLQERYTPGSLDHFPFAFSL